MMCNGMCTARKAASGSLVQLQPLIVTATASRRFAGTFCCAYTPRNPTCQPYSDATSVARKRCWHNTSTAVARAWRRSSGHSSSQHQWPSGRPVACMSTAPDTSAQPTPVLLLFELEGAVVDMHMDGHRVAFNRAFQDLGYDCIQWPPQVYNDLLAMGDGSPETLLLNYFNMMGWPTMLATSDQGSFVKKVHAAKQQALARMLMAGQVPLRSCVQQVMEEAVGAGARVVWLAGTLSETSDLIARNALAQLPQAVAQHIQVYNSNAVPQDARYSLKNASDVHESGSGLQPHEGQQAEHHATPDEGCSSMDDTLPACALRILKEQQTQAKQAQVAEFVNTFSQLAGSDAGVPALGVHPSLLANGSRSVRPEWLAAVTAMQGVPCSRAVMLAASNVLTEAAAGAGMHAVAVPRKMASRGTFNGASAKFDGFGPGECTWVRLQQFVSPRKPATSGM